MSSLPPSPRKLLECAGLVQDAPLSETPRRNLFRWALLGVALVGVLSILAGRNPEQLALPGLFTLGYSALVGFAMSEMGQVLRVFPSSATATENSPENAAEAVPECGRLFGRLVWSYVAAITLGGLISVSWQWYGRYVVRTTAEYQKNPIQEHPLGDVFPTEPPADATPEELEMYQALETSAAERQQMKRVREESLRFTGYLKTRLEGFGFLKSLRAPWPMVLWLLEILTGAMVAGWIAHRGSFSKRISTESVP